MTQTTRTQRTPAAPNDDDGHEVLHTAAVALAVFFWLIAAAAIMRITHVPGWIPLVVHVVIGAARALAGLHRSPRPLSLRSIVYRFLAMFLVGQWLFWNIADTGRGGQEVLAMVCQILLVGAVTVTLFYGVRAGHWKLALAGGGVLLVVGESVITALAGTAGGGGAAWINHALTTTAALDKTNFLSWLWPGVFVSAGTMCTVGSILGQIFASHEREEDDRKALTQMLRSTGRAQQAMTELLHEFANDKRLQCIDVKPWKNGAGETYEIHTAAAGMGWKDLAHYINQVADRMMLDDGCGVEAAKGKKRGLALLHVTRKNRLAENHNYPMDAIRKRNVYEGLPVGVLRPGDQVCIEIRENGVFVIGQKRSGKTLWLDVLMADLGQCVDTLIWVIDFNGGGVALPYLYAFAEGRARRPMIDWVADGEDEALRMAETALKIAGDRKQFYTNRKRQAKVNLLPVDKDVPEIVILMDEGAEAMGDSTSLVSAKVCATLEKLQRIAGDSGVNVVFSFLRATSDAVNPAVKKQSPIRVAMRVSDSEELAYLFGDYKMDPDNAPYAGSGFIQPGHAEPVRVFKGYYLDPDMMDEIAVKVSDWRPYLDLRGRQIGGDVYRNRWQRTRHMLLDGETGEIRDDLNLDVDADAPTTHAPGSRGVQAAEAGQPAPVQGPSVPAGTATAVLDDVDVEKLARRRRVAGMEPGDIEGRAGSVVDRLRQAGGAGDPDAAFSAIVEREFGGLPEWPDQNGAGAPPPAPVPGGPPPSAPTPATGGGGPVDRLATLERIVLQHGPIGRSELWEKLKEAGVKVSLPTMDKDLERADWVAPREKGQPYDHKNRTDNSKT